MVLQEQLLISLQNHSVSFFVSCMSEYSRYPYLVVRLKGTEVVTMGVILLVFAVVVVVVVVVSFRGGR